MFNPFLSAVSFSKWDILYTRHDDRRHLPSRERNGFLAAGAFLSHILEAKKQAALAALGPAAAVNYTMYNPVDMIFSPPGLFTQKQMASLYGGAGCICLSVPLYYNVKERYL